MPPATRPARTSALPRAAPPAGWCPCPRRSSRSTRPCPAPLLALLVELLAGEEHERIAQQLDLDPVGILEVHRLLDAAIGSGVLHARLVQPVADLLPAVARSRDRDVLHTADGLDARLEAEPWEVEEPQQRAVPEVEEEVRRARVVPVLDKLDEREAEQILVEPDRLLDVGADQRRVVDAPAGGRRPVRRRTEVVPPELRTTGFELDELGLTWHGAHLRRPDPSHCC